MWFALGTIAGKAVALLSLPIFARLLTPAEFGRLDVLNALVSAGLATLLLGTDIAATRLYFDGRDAERQRILSSWLVLVGAVVVPCAIALSLFASPISQSLFGNSDSALAVSLVGVVLLVGSIHVVVLGVLRTTGRAQAYGLLEGAALLLNAALAIVLLLAWRHDAAAVMLALAASWGVAAVVGLVAVRRAIAAPPTTSAVGALLRLGLPLAPAVAAAFVGDFINRSLLLATAGADQAGFLSIAIRVASIGGLLVAAAQLAWQPLAYRMGDAPDALARLGDQGRRVLVSVATLVTVLCALTPETIALLGGGRYAPAGPATALCLVTVLLTGVYVVVSLPSAMAKATSDLGWSGMAGVATSLVVNTQLAPAMGASGTALAMLAGQTVAVTVAAWRVRRHPRPSVWTMRTAAVVAVALAVGILSASAWELPIVVRVALTIAVLALAWIEGTLRSALADVLGWLRAR